MTTKTTTPPPPTDEGGKPPQRRPREAHWPSVLLYIHLHLGSLYGLYVVFTAAKIITTLFAVAVGAVSLLGVTAGAHRLWAHRCYSAKTPLRVFLALCQTVVGQCSLYDWILDHRTHHKHFGTEQDRYNHHRGLYHAQIGCRLVKTLPEEETEAQATDMSDIEKDSVVMWQRRLYWLAMPILCWLLPINAPVEYWGETITNSVFVVGVLRYTVVLHLSWLINTSVQVWSTTPENRTSDSNMVFLVTRSYWPQYHYLLPWDYQTTEYGSYGCGCTTAFIKMSEAVGWAYGLKTIDTPAVKRILETVLTSGKDIRELLEEENKAIEEREDFLHHYKIGPK